MPSEGFNERLTRRLLLRRFHMLILQIGQEGKWGQRQDGTVPGCPHFAHRTRKGKRGTLFQRFPPHCPSPEQLNWDWRTKEKPQSLTQRHTAAFVKNTTEICSYLRSQPSMRGLCLWLLGSEEAERFSLARAWSAGESGGVHGAEGGWKSSECGGGVSVTSRRSSESTVSVIIPSVSVLSTVTPPMLHWLSASPTWDRKWGNMLQRKKMYTDQNKFLPLDLVLLCMGLLVAGGPAELRVCSRLEEMVLNSARLHAGSIYCRDNATTSQSSRTFGTGQNNRMDHSSSRPWGVSVQTW